MSIAIIDTSVFCNLLQVPEKCQHLEQVLAELRALVSERAVLMLPLGTIIETGNHIAQCTHAVERRKAARRFCESVRKSISQEAPWSYAHSEEGPDIEWVLLDFPDNASRQIGIADAMIIGEWKRQCELHPARRVFIWQRDRHLAGYDQPASVGNRRVAPR